MAILLDNTTVCLKTSLSGCCFSPVRVCGGKFRVKGGVICFAASFFKQELSGRAGRHVKVSAAPRQQQHEQQQQLQQQQLRHSHRVVLPETVVIDRSLRASDLWPDSRFVLLRHLPPLPPTQGTAPLPPPSPPPHVDKRPLLQEAIPDGRASASSGVAARDEEARSVSGGGRSGTSVLRVAREGCTRFLLLRQQPCYGYAVLWCMHSFPARATCGAFVQAYVARTLFGPQCYACT